LAPPVPSTRYPYTTLFRSEAVANASTVKKVVTLRRTGNDVPFDESRDVWWHEAVEVQSADAESCPCEPMDSEDLLYLLYTSGTTDRKSTRLNSSHVAIAYA